MIDKGDPTKDPCNFREDTRPRAAKTISEYIIILPFFILQIQIFPCTKKVRTSPHNRSKKDSFSNLMTKHQKVIPTADLVSYFRIFSDIPFVNEIADLTNAEKTARDILGESFDSSYFIAPMAEARYKRIDLQAKKYKNILEIAVGRSPRGLILTADPSVNYVATDLSDSLESYKNIIEKLIPDHHLKRPNLHFFPANALHLNELESASKLLPPDPVAIISEGFMVYLTMQEKKTFLQNIRQILLQRDGVLITSDVTFSKKTDNINHTMLDAMAYSTKIDMRDHSFDDMEDAKQFFQEAGFISESFLDKVEITSLKKLHLEQDSASQRTTSLPIWVLRPSF